MCVCVCYAVDGFLYVLRVRRWCLLCLRATQCLFVQQSSVAVAEEQEIIRHTWAACRCYVLSDIDTQVLYLIWIISTSFWRKNVTFYFIYLHII